MWKCLHSQKGREDKIKKTMHCQKNATMNSTLAVNSVKEVIFCSAPLIPTWHSYMRSDCGTLGRSCVHL